ncbi:MAG: response regulator [Verrucomicrobiota bacterium]
MTPKILSVDDSKMIHMVIGKAFKPFDVQLFYATNGVEGLAVATRENPNLIILDVTMPVMDGVETLTKLKSDPLLKDIPVIMLTAEAGRENVVKIARIGVRDYMIKPFKEEALIEKASRILELQAKGAGAGKAKSIADPATLLVVDDKQAIIQQVQEAVAEYPWTVTGTGQCGEAIDLSARETPDAVLVSLSLPDRAAFNFFQMIRANPKTKSIPVFGMCIKTALDEQNQAQAMGFTGIITKPLDPVDLNYRLTKAMNLDTSPKYFKMDGNLMISRLPHMISDVITSEINSHIKPKTQEMVESGVAKMVIDVTEVTKIDMSTIKIMLSIMQNCADLSIKYRVAGSPEFVAQAKTFAETKDLQIYPSREAAKEGF